MATLACERCSWYIPDPPEVERHRGYSQGQCALEPRRVTVKPDHFCSHFEERVVG